ncbi:MAG: hypothetical protein U0807_09765 [Candidatus Binatia bacterium]
MSGRGTLRGLGNTYALSASALRRHRAAHLPEVLIKGKSLDDIATAESLVDQVRTLRARILALLAKAETDGDHKTQLAALRELRALAELEARGADRDATVIHVSVVQQYVHRVIEVVREFVPPEHYDEAIARIQAAAHREPGDVTPSRPILPGTGSN